MHAWGNGLAVASIELTHFEKHCCSEPFSYIQAHSLFSTMAIGAHGHLTEETKDTSTSFHSCPHMPVYGWKIMEYQAHSQDFPEGGYLGVCCVCMYT